MCQHFSCRDWFALVPVLCLCGPGECCTLCGPTVGGRQTMRQLAERTTTVLIGTLGTARENIDALGGGTTEFHIRRIIKGPSGLKKGQTVVLPRYLPGDLKSERPWLLFGDVRDGLFYYESGIRLSSIAVADYLRELLTIGADASRERLQFCAKKLDDSTPEISADAFHELARASDAEINELALKLQPEPMRKLLASPEVPVERLSLFAFLLSCCGDKSDAALLRSLLDENSERSRAAYSGLLAGYAVVAPAEGWKYVTNVLRDAKRPFLQRYAAVGALRFLKGTQRKELREKIVDAAAEAVQHADLADMVIEDLRRWSWWELTSVVLNAAKKKSHDGPMIRRAVVRYALCCPKAETIKFIAEYRHRDPEFVTEMEESLSDELQPMKAPPPIR